MKLTRVPGINAIVYPFLLIALVIAAISSCNKTESAIVPKQPKASFSVIVSDPFNSSQWPDNDEYRDFYYYFRNSSDSGDMITYHWDFGDGSRSSEKSPKHQYAARGVYNVKLTVTSQNSLQATDVQTVKVISGQRHINLGDNIYIQPIAIEETPTNEFVLLAKDLNWNQAYFFQLDSLFREKSRVIFPAGYWFTSMKPTADGNYILTGSTRELFKSNEIVKVKPDGTLLWHKLLNQDDTYTSVAPAPDGGYYTIGTRALLDERANPVYISVVIKTDNNGVEQWQKVLEAEKMRKSGDAIIDNDGIVLAGNKPGGLCDCDSALIVKIGNDGNTIWANTKAWGLSNFIMWDTRIARLANGNFIVNNMFLNALMFFSPSGEFLDRKLAPYRVNSVIPTSDGNFVSLMTQNDNGTIMHVNKMTPAGVELWHVITDGRQKTPDGDACCTVSTPVAINKMRNGGTISAGYRIFNNSNYSGTHDVIVLIPLDDAGNLK